MRYGFEWTPGVVLLGSVVVLPLVPGFALIALVLFAIAAVAALVALAAALVAAPFLLVRLARRRLEGRQLSMHGLFRLPRQPIGHDSTL